MGSNNVGKNFIAWLMSKARLFEYNFLFVAGVLWLAFFLIFAYIGVHFIVKYW